MYGNYDTCYNIQAIRLRSFIVKLKFEIRMLSNNDMLLRGC